MKGPENVFWGGTEKLHSEQQKSAFRMTISRNASTHGAINCPQGIPSNVVIHHTDSVKEAQCYIPSVLRHILTLYPNWDDLGRWNRRFDWTKYVPPVDVEYLTTLAEELGHPAAMFSRAPAVQSWEASPDGKKDWDFICETLRIGQQVAQLRRANDANYDDRVVELIQRANQIKKKRSEFTARYQRICSPTDGPIADYDWNLAQCVAWICFRKEESLRNVYGVQPLKMKPDSDLV